LTLRAQRIKLFSARQATAYFNQLTLQLLHFCEVLETLISQRVASVTVFDYATLPKYSLEIPFLESKDLVRQEHLHKLSLETRK
jgi:hypothetical protein